MKFFLQEFLFEFEALSDFFLETDTQSLQEIFFKGFTYLFSLSTDREKMAAM